MDKFKDMDKFKEKEVMKKRTLTENIWYDWYEIIKYISELIKTVSGVKDKIMSLFKPWDYSKPKRVKNVYKSGKKPSKLRIQK